MNDILEQLKKEQSKYFKAVNTQSGNTVRCAFENDNKTSIFVYARNKRRYGWRFTEDEFLARYEPKPNGDEEKAWKRRLKRAVKLCRESGLWSELAEVWDNLYKYVSLDEKNKIYDLYWNDKDKAIEYCKAHYPFMLGKRDDGNEYINTEYIWELSRCELKTMYFGFWNASEKENIRKAIAEKRKYVVPRLHLKYDISFNYNPELAKAWYSEEYRNCGNGHYYLALNHSTAVFCEND